MVHSAPFLNAGLKSSQKPMGKEMKVVEDLQPLDEVFSEENVE